eukprot:gene162-277_t
MMRTTLLGMALGTASAFQPMSSNVNRLSFVSKFSSNVDAFGGGDVSKSTELTDGPSIGLKYNIKTDNYKDEAAKLREEATQLEVALREEARAKGLPEEVINKLVPLQGAKRQATTTAAAVIEVPKLSSKQLRAKLGYLNTGDATRMVSELDRLKSKSLLTLWNSKDFSGVSFGANNAQMNSKTGIDIAKLRLDDAGFDYQKVFGLALLFATVFGLSASFVGGQLGFLLGYASALFPVLLVGVGSIAPALIADILNQIKYATNEQEREKYVQKNAAKFLVGYVTGLPVAAFSNRSPSNLAQFFQLRPSGKSEAEDRKMFSSRRFSQQDISRSAVTCVAGAVSECMGYGEASGSSGTDVNILYELLNAVDPPLKPEASQNYVRWSIIAAHDILKQHEGQLAKLKVAFAEGLALEECIAIMEGDDAGSSMLTETDAKNDASVTVQTTTMSD